MEIHGNREPTWDLCWLRAARPFFNLFHNREDGRMAIETVSVEQTDPDLHPDTIRVHLITLYFGPSAISSLSFVGDIHIFVNLYC